MYDTYLNQNEKKTQTVGIFIKYARDLVGNFEILELGCVHREFITTFDDL